MLMETTMVRVVEVGMAREGGVTVATRVFALSYVVRCPRRGQIAKGLTYAEAYALASVGGCEVVVEGL